MYSELKHKIELMQLTHKHEKVKLEMKQKNELEKLLSSCTHNYDDGRSAKEMHGMQRDYYYKCSICNKNC